MKHYPLRQSMYNTWNLIMLVHFFPYPFDISILHDSSARGYECNLDPISLKPGGRGKMSGEDDTQNAGCAMGMSGRMQREININLVRRGTMSVMLSLDL